MFAVLQYFSFTCLVNILTCNNQKDDKESSQVAPLVYCRAMSWGASEGARCAGGCQPGLPASHWVHTGTQGPEEPEKGIRESLKATLSFYSEGKNSEIVKGKVLRWSSLSFSPTAKLLRQLSLWQTLALSFSRGNSDVGLACFTSNKDSTSCTERCCGIQLLLSG